MTLIKNPEIPNGLGSSLDGSLDTYHYQLFSLAIALSYWSPREWFYSYFHIQPNEQDGFYFLSNAGITGNVISLPFFFSHNRVYWLSSSTWSGLYFSYHFKHGYLNADDVCFYMACGHSGYFPHCQYYFFSAFDDFYDFWRHSYENGDDFHFIY